VKNKPKKILISACLLGENVKYDGNNNDVSYNSIIKTLIEKNLLLPVCPEVLGGLSIPRTPVELTNAKAINKDGIDQTKEFKKGAKESLHVALKYDIKIAIMKSKSPSCGSDFIYDGTFSKKLIKGDGLTVEILKKNGIKVFNEEELDTLLVYLRKKYL